MKWGGIPNYRERSRLNRKDSMPLRTDMKYFLFYFLCFSTFSDKGIVNTSPNKISPKYWFFLWGWMVVSQMLNVLMSNE